MTIPLDAIDPTAQADRWLRSFEHHLDLVPLVMDALVTATVPVAAVSRGGSRFDRPKITGNNDEDNMTAFLRGVDVVDGRVVGVGAAADAELLWWWVVTFTRAIAANIRPTRPAPALADRPDADPLSARSVALVAVGWLIDHADQIQQLAVYESDIDEMFQEIRHLRGKYGVHDHPRRPRARCATCGTLSVVVTWVDGLNGSPKPVRAGKCRVCGEEYRDAPDPVDESRAASSEVRSEACADLRHEMCQSVHCGCSCHDHIRGASNPDSSGRSSPSRSLRRLTMAEVPFRWNPEQRKAVGERLARILRLPDASTITDDWWMDSYEGGALLHVKLAATITLAEANAIMNGVPLDPEPDDDVRWQYCYVEVHPNGDVKERITFYDLAKAEQWLADNAEDLAGWNAEVRKRDRATASIERRTSPEPGPWEPVTPRGEQP